jgi:dGTPase
VAQIARTIARALRLNEDLAEAIALGHDMGHTPFGHGGEIALKEIYSERFSHQAQSLRVVDHLERGGEGLNLTHEVRDGILKHSKGYGKIIPDDPDETACTIEGRIVRVADIMAYLNHDLDDAIRSGVISDSQIPESCSTHLGRNHSDRATTMIKDLIYNSSVGSHEIVLNMSDDVFSAMTTLRQFLYDNVYRSNRVHKEFIKAKKILYDLYHHFLDHPEQLTAELAKMRMPNGDAGQQKPEQRVCDFIASLTDSHALEIYHHLFFPSPLVSPTCS